MQHTSIPVDRPPGNALAFFDIEKGPKIVNSDDITTQQARELHEAFHPTLGNLTLLSERLNKLGFPPDDKLLLVVQKAQDALQHLTVELHYMSCPTGVARPPRS